MANYNDSYKSDSSKFMVTDSYDASYWDSLFTGTDYESLYNSIKSQYSNEPQGSLWGTITGQDQTNMYLHNQERNNALAALAEKMYNEQFESPESQVKRQRQAGINPDLAGVSNQVASEPQKQSANNNIQSANPMDVISTASSVIQTAQSAFVNVLNLFQSFKLQKQDIITKEINNGKNKVELARDLFKLAGSGSKNGLNLTLYDFSFLGSSKRSRKKWIDDVSSIANGMINGGFNDFGTRSYISDNENKYNDSRYKRFTMPVSSDMSDENLKYVLADIANIVWASEEWKRKAELLGYQRSHSENEFQDRLNRTKSRNFNLWYNSESAKRDAEKARADYEKAYHKAMKDLLFNRGILGMTAALQFQNKFSAYSSLRGIFAPY